MNANSTTVQLNGRQIIVDTTPKAFGSATFRTKSLVQLGADRLTLRPSLGSWLFGGIFLTLGLTGLAVPLAGFLDVKSTGGAWVGGIGLLFTFVGLSQMLFPQRFLFDRKTGKFTVISFRQQEARQLAVILAVQLLERYEKIPRTCELNLVLDDKKQPRLNVSNHADINATHAQAHCLAEFLGVPLLQNTTKPEITLVVEGRQIAVATAPVESRSGGQANCRTMAMVQSRDDCLVLRASWGLRCFAGISILAGAWMWMLGLFALFAKEPLIGGFCLSAIMGLLFALCGVWTFNQCGHHVFDRKSGQWTMRRFLRVQVRPLSGILAV